MERTLKELSSGYTKNIALKDLELNNGKYPVFGASGYIKNIDFYISDRDYIGIVKDGSGVGRVDLYPAYSSLLGTMQYILPNDNVDIKYLMYALRHMDLGNTFSGAAIPHIYYKNYCNNKLKYYDISTQRFISSNLSNIEKAIDICKKRLFYLDELIKSRFVELFGDSEFNTMHWSTKKLSELCDVGSSKRVYKNEQSTEGIPFLRISDLNERIDNVENTPDLFIPINKYNELRENGLVPAVGDILVTSRGTLGRCYIVKPKDEFYFQDGMISWLSDLNNQITSLYLSQLFSMEGIQKQIVSLQAGSTIAYLSISMLKKLDIMLPPLDLQNQFATFVEQTDKSKSIVQKQITDLQELLDSKMDEYFG